MEKVIYGVNFIFLLLITWFESNSDSDKTVILSSIGVSIIIVPNFGFGFFAQLDKKPVYKHYYFSALGLILGAIILLS